jgi:hypothetical protein
LKDVLLKRTLPLALVLLMLAVVPLALRAQSADPITATVDKTVLTTDEILTLRVAVEASSGTPPQPVMPALDGFNLISTNMTFINNVVTGEVIYIYFLQPYRAGTLAIQPISVFVNGQTYSTLPILVQVSQGSTVPTPQAAPPLLPPTDTPGAPSLQPAATLPASTAPTASGPAPSSTADGNLFVEAVVDNPTPYVGQQVLYKFRVYQAETLGAQPSYQGPTFTGFWNNQQPAQEIFMATVNNQRYRVTELTNAIFPTASGDVTIDRAELVIPAGVMEPEIRLNSAPVDLTVRPLPSGAPAGFDGAVGQYTISVRTDTSLIDGTNDSVRLQVTISGAGNLEALPDPEFPENGDWRVYDTRTTTNSEFVNSITRGSRVIEYTLVPTAEGQVTIPPVNFVYFDPLAETYNTISTNPMSVNVAPGAAQAPAQAPTQASAVPTEPTPTPMPTAEPGVPPTLPELKPAEDGLASLPRPLIQEPAFWLLWLVPIIAFVGELFIRRRERYMNAHEDEIRSSRALRQARKALAQARRRREDPHGAAARVLNGYLTDKLNQPVAGMTRAALTQALLARRIAPALIERVDTCLSASEAGRYGGPSRGQDNGHAVLNETERLLKELDREFAP